MIISIACYGGLIGVAFLIAVWLSRGLEDEREHLGDDQYQDARIREEASK